jgi:hypothetical protein
MFRNGQWVKFRVDPKPEGAHCAADGRVVGIFQRGGPDPLKPITIIPPHIVCVKADGKNLRRLDAEGQAVLVNYPPDEVADCQAITDRTDLPPGRLFAEGWTPRA